MSQGGLCPICRASIASDEARTPCPSCATDYHLDCWEDNRGCAMHGCPMVPPTEHLTDVEIPASVWGADEKACPACSKTILAAARRCRHCGTMLAPDRVQTPAEFDAERRRARGLPAVRRGAILVFAFAAIPCTAPFALVAGLLWRNARRAELAALPPLYSTVLLAGLGLAALETVLMTLIALASIALP